MPGAFAAKPAFNSTVVSSLLYLRQLPYNAEVVGIDLEAPLIASATDAAVRKDLSDRCTSKGVHQTGAGPYNILSASCVQYHGKQDGISISGVCRQSESSCRKLSVERPVQLHSSR